MQQAFYATIAEESGFKVTDSHQAVDWRCQGLTAACQAGVHPAAAGSSAGAVAADGDAAAVPAPAHIRQLWEDCCTHQLRPTQIVDDLTTFNLFGMICPSAIVTMVCVIVPGLLPAPSIMAPSHKKPWLQTEGAEGLLASHRQSNSDRILSTPKGCPMHPQP